MELPEPTPPIQDETFERLKADVLHGLAQADAGLLVDAEDMRAMFGIEPEKEGRWPA
jgi:hypothetical protein